MCYGRYQRRIASVAFTISDRERLLAEVKYYGMNIEGQPTVDSLATVYISFLIFFIFAINPCVSASGNCVRQRSCIVTPARCVLASLSVYRTLASLSGLFTEHLLHSLFTEHLLHSLFSEHLLHSTDIYSLV